VYAQVDADRCTAQVDLNFFPLQALTAWRMIVDNRLFHQ